MSSRRAVEAVGPEVRTGRRVDQLAGDAHPVAGLPDRAFEHVAHAQLAGHLPHIDRLALVGEARIAGDHGEPGKAGDRDGDLLDHAVGEILLLGVSAHVLERQYRERGLIGREPRIRRLVRARSLVRSFGDLADETDALAVEGADETLRCAVVAQGPARRVDPGGQRGFRDDPPVPDGFEQIVLDDDTSAVADEKYQEIEDFRLNLDPLRAAPQLTTLDIEAVVAERQKHATPPADLQLAARQIVSPPYGERKAAVRLRVPKRGILIPTDGEIIASNWLGEDIVNSFAMIFGHCVWIPPSPKAALVALNLFFGIGTPTQPDIIAAEAIIAAQYVAGGKTQVEAQNKIAWLNACFEIYEVLPEKRNHPEEAKLAPLRNVEAPINK